MKDLKDILEGIFDEEDNVRKLDKHVNFSSWIKKLTNPHTFEKSSKDFIKEIVKDGAKRISWTSMEYDEGNYVRIMKAIDKDTNEEFARIDIFIYEGHKRWKDHILHYQSKKASVNIIGNWMTDFIRMEGSFIERIEYEMYTLPDNWIDFIKFIEKEYDKSYINESIFDDEDVQMDKLDDVTKFGNFYTLWWYEVSKEHDFSYFFKKSDIKKLASKQGYFDRDWFGIALKHIRGTMMSNTKNQYMLPLCNLLGHLQFDMNIEVFKKTVEDFVKANERGPVQVSVEEGNVQLDEQITITLRRVTDEGIKKLLMRFKKKK